MRHDEGGQDSMMNRPDSVGRQVDRRVARLTALWVTLALAGYLVSGAWWIPAGLFLDFLLRGFGLGNRSPLAASGRWVASALRWAPQPQWAAPKVFAAKLGCLFSLLILIVDLAGADVFAKILAAGLLALASLEAFAGFCIGCRIHALVHRLGR
jgi:hypothetical protein